MYRNITALIAILSASAFALPTFKTDAELEGTLKKILDSSTGETRQVAFATAEEAGVEEGGIFSRSGKFLVYLRKGVLYSIDAAKVNELQQVDSIWGGHPDLDKKSWVDEMIVKDNHVVTISHRYNSKNLWVILPAGAEAAAPVEDDSRSFTEINLFSLDGEGKLSHVDHVLFEATDYFSGDNYASRFVGDKLVSYSPLWFAYQNTEKRTGVRVPQVYKVVDKVLKAQHKLLKPTDVNLPVDEISADTKLSSFHFCSVNGKLDCETRAFFSKGWGGVHYVTAEDLFFWTEGNVFKLNLQSRDLAYHPAAGTVLNQFSMKDLNGTLHALSHSYHYVDGKEASQAMLYGIPLSAFKAQIEVSTTAAAGKAKALRPELSKLLGEVRVLNDERAAIWKQMQPLQEELYAQGTSDQRKKELERLLMPLTAKDEAVTKKLEPVYEKQGKLMEALSTAEREDREERSASVRRASWKASGIQVNRFVGSNLIFSMDSNGGFFGIGGESTPTGPETTDMTLSRVDVKATSPKLTTQVLATLGKEESGRIIQLVPLDEKHVAVVRNVTRNDESKQVEEQFVGMYSAVGLRKVMEHKLAGSSQENRSHAYGLKYDSAKRRGILTVPTKPESVKPDFGGATHDIGFYAFDLNKQSFERVYTYSPIEEDTKPTVGSLIDWYGSARVAFFTDADGVERTIGVSGYAMAEIVQEDDGSYITGEELSLEIPEWQKVEIQELGQGGAPLPGILPIGPIVP